MKIKNGSSRELALSRTYAGVRAPTQQTSCTVGSSIPLARYLFKAYISWFERYRINIHTV